MSEPLEQIELVIILYISFIALNGHLQRSLLTLMGNPTASPQGVFRDVGLRTALSSSLLCNSVDHPWFDDGII